MASQLSPRQREILDLVAEGRTSKEIAVALGISESTVNWHLANAFSRLGASSRAEAVALAIRSNGDRIAEPKPRVRSVPASAWPRLVAIAVAIAIAGALLGGATVATLRLGPIPPVQAPAASPTNGAVSTPSASPAGGAQQDVMGGDVAPAGGGDKGTGTAGGGLLPTTPANLLPTVTAPPLPSVSLPVPTPPLPTLPVTPPPLPSLPLPSLPLPSVPLPLPTPIPTPQLSLP